MTNARLNIHWPSKSRDDEYLSLLPIIFQVELHHLGFYKLVSTDFGQSNFGNAIKSTSFVSTTSSAEQKKQLVAILCIQISLD